VTGLVQASQVAVSSLHWKPANPEPRSVAVKAKVAVISMVGLTGVCVRRVSGGVLSIVNVRVGG